MFYVAVNANYKNVRLNSLTFCTYLGNLNFPRHSTQFRLPPKYEKLHIHSAEIVSSQLVRFAIAGSSGHRGSRNGFRRDKTARSVTVQIQTVTIGVRATSLRSDRDELFGNKRTLPGPEREGGPQLAAEEEYAHRAYPAKDIPLTATLNAIDSLRTNVRARSMGTGHAPLVPGHSSDRAREFS